jgi:hypothetical protein
MDAWLSQARDSIARSAGLSPDELEIGDADAATLLDLARIAAHESGERTNAPLLCYLVGRAEGAASLDELAEAVRGLS